MSWYVFDFIAHFLTYIWCHDKSFDVTACFWCHWRVWRVCDIMANFLKYVALIDGMTNVLMSWKFLTTWHTFYVLTHDMFFTLWRTFLSWWRIFVIISGTKYNVYVISILWRFLWYYDMHWCHDKRFDVVAKFFTFGQTVYIMTYIWLYDFLTSWLTLWLDFCRSDIIFRYFGDKI